MRDRLGALDGRVALVTAASHGTVVWSFVPLRRGQTIRHLHRSGDMPPRLTLRGDEQSPLAQRGYRAAPMRSILFRVSDDVGGPLREWSDVGVCL
jgi:hypothetical protein